VSIYLPEYKAAFIHIPKTAGQSIDAWLNRNFVAVRYFPHLSAKQFKQFVKIDWYFSVVRNPWDRVVSGFFYWKQLDKEHGKMNGVDDETTFEEFVTNIDVDSSVVYDRQTNSAHLISQNQVDWFDDGEKTILRFENLESDFTQIQSKFANFDKLPRVNCSDHKSYREYYNEQTKQRVQDIFSRDIEQFNYEF